MTDWRPDPERSSASWVPDLRDYAALVGPDAVAALRAGLEANDPTLLHARCTFPSSPFDAKVPDCDLEGCCLLLYGPWRVGRIKTVREAAALIGELMRAKEPPYRFMAITRAWDNLPVAQIRVDVLKELSEHPGGVPG